MNPSAPQPPPARIWSLSVGITDALSFTEQSHHIYIQAQSRPWYAHVSSAQHTVAHTYANMHRIHISIFDVFRIHIQPNIKTESSKSPAGENMQEDVLCCYSLSGGNVLKRADKNTGTKHKLFFSQSL